MRRMNSTGRGSTFVIRISSLSLTPRPQPGPAEGVLVASCLAGIRWVGCARFRSLYSDQKWAIIPPLMKFNAQQYLDCSRLRVESARRLHEQERFSAAIYLAGVGIECLLRAYIVRKNPAFDERHDLREMLKSSDLDLFVKVGDRQQVAAWLTDVWTRWKNDYRYASDERLKSEFKRRELDRGINGNFLKENSRLVIETALQLQAKGELQWRSKKK
ncbi:MAG TPA: hypothetical protein DDZ88_19035 [Verrucomicrobiales bacterium]|nr:hypothetical protein [Verrucomicrobiales bacterium]